MAQKNTRKKIIWALYKALYKRMYIFRVGMHFSSEIHMCLDWCRNLTYQIWGQNSKFKSYQRTLYVICWVEGNQNTTTSFILCWKPIHACIVVYIQCEWAIMLETNTFLHSSLHFHTSMVLVMCVTDCTSVVYFIFFPSFNRVWITTICHNVPNGKDQSK